MTINNFMYTLDQFRNKNGHIVIPLSRVQVVEFFKGALGICDSCNETDKEGYLIPVLAGRWYCTKCYNEWEASAEYYAEDKKYEEAKAFSLLKTIALREK